MFGSDGIKCETEVWKNTYVKNTINVMIQYFMIFKSESSILYINISKNTNNT